MNRDDLVDLNAFAVVAQLRSFTRAAAQLNLSQSALSHAIRRLEQQLGLRLLDRSTRSVAPTAAGERLLSTLAPALEEIHAELLGLKALGRRPGGRLRITAPAWVARRILMPKLMVLSASHPELEIEVSADQQLPDIIRGHFDAGVRIGEQLDKDMIALPIGPELRLAVVASPRYFQLHGMPMTPHDLKQHRCINYRRPATGRIYNWEFDRDGHELTFKPPGPLCCNHPDLLVEAALADGGIICLTEDHVEDELSQGRLQRVLVDWCGPFPGYHLYYASRRHNSAAMKLLVEVLRFPPRPQPASTPMQAGPIQA